MAGEHGGVVLLAAEAAAGLHLDHAHLLQGQLEQFVEGMVHVVGALHRAPHQHAPGRGLPDDGVGLDVDVLLCPGVIGGIQAQVTQGRGGLRIPLGDEDGLEDVVLAPDDRVAAQALLDPKHGGQGLHVHPHPLPGILDPQGIGMGQQHDGLFGMVDHTIGQAGLVKHQVGHRVLSGDVPGRDDDELRPGEPLFEMDAGDPPPGDTTADRGPVEQALDPEVVREGGGPGDLGTALLALNRAADVGEVVHGMSSVS